MVLQPSSIPQRTKPSPGAGLASIPATAQRRAHIGSSRERLGRPVGSDRQANVQIGSTGVTGLAAFRNEKTVSAVAATVDDARNVLVHIVEEEEIVPQ